MTKLIWCHEKINDEYYAVCEITGRLALAFQKEKIELPETEGEGCEYAEICKDTDCPLCEMESCERLVFNIHHTVLNDFSNLVLMPKFIIPNKEFLVELEVCEND